MNRILYASDCLKVLHDRDALPDESVALIYLDPPFNSNSQYNLPFKGKYKTAQPVEAFDDTWHWTDENTEQLEELDADPRTRALADIVKFAQKIDQGTTSLGAYLINMAVRLYAMRRVLKKTGSIYIHCDSTAGHYLKLVMDAVFGQKAYRNEIIWKRTSGHSDARRFGRSHDVILYYSLSNKGVWNQTFQPYNDDYVEQYYRYSDPDGRRWMSGDLSAAGLQGGGYEYEWKGITRVWRVPLRSMEKLDSEGKVFYTKNGIARRKRYLDESKGLRAQDIWTDIEALRSWHEERLGYPTQKPEALLERIIRASSNEGDLVLDPFCGCGTTVHAAENLGRRWIGIDISSFSTGLVRERLLRAFPLLDKDAISMEGEIPLSIDDARSLSHRNKFEFEKWVCGHIGAEGMFHDPGTPGADGGVDGVLKFYRIRSEKKLKPEYAIVQVKGGHVTADAVRALRTTVDRFEVTAGVMVCFDQYMRTVDNQRSRETFRDALGTYPVIQGYSVENLLDNEPLNLPLYGLRRQGARLIA